MSRRAAVVVALAAAFLPPAWCSADEPQVPATWTGAPIAGDSSPASLLHPATLRAAFRVPRVGTALYVGTPWYVRDLSVTVVGPGERRETIAATTDLPGRMLGLRLPADAWQADRVELEATTVSAAAPPYLLPAEQLAQIGWRNWWYAALFGLFAMLALLHGALAAMLRSRTFAWFAAAMAGEAGLLVPWLGIVRPPPEISQPLHAVMQSLVYAGLAFFTLAFLRDARLPRAAVIGTLALTLLNVIDVAGGDVLQDFWPVPDLASQLLVAFLMLAYVALGILGARRHVEGARYYLAAAEIAALGSIAVMLPSVPDALARFVPLLATAVMALLLALALAIRLRNGARAHAASANTAQLDGLTGIANRTALDNGLARAWSAASRARAPLAALFVDLDHFRKYNDEYGHLAGDDVLRRVATALARLASRGDDLAGRYAGDKLLMLLPNTDLAGARHVAAAVRSAVLALEIAHGGAPSRRLTASIGVAALIPEHGTAAGASDLLRRADTALYVAKTMGRNRVVADEPIAPPAALH